MALPKNQHYVPQELLKGFFSEGKKIHIFDVQKNEFYWNQSTRNWFAERYFYQAPEDTRAPSGEGLEDLLANKIEGPSSPLIKDIRDKESVKILEDHDNLNNIINLMQVQATRTKQARDDLIKLYSSRMSHSKKQLREAATLATTVPLAFSLLKKESKNLAFHLVKNVTSKRFILSDNPLLKENWLHGRKFRSDMKAEGFQMFMPLSDRLYLFIYDPRTYKFANRNISVSEIKDVRDVNWLNERQTRRAESLIAFSNILMEKEICRLYKKTISTAEKYYKPSFFKLVKKPEFELII